MSATDITSFLISSQMRNTRLNVALSVMKNEQQQQQALMNVIAEGFANGAALEAASPPGMGGVVDVTV